MPEITQEELDLFNKYKELGDVDAVTSELSAKQQMERTNVINEVAQLSGYKPNVLAQLGQELTFEVKEGKAYVGDKTVEEYAQENWADFLPSLKAEEQKNGVSFVKQPTKPLENKSNISTPVISYLKNIYGNQKETVIN